MKKRETTHIPYSAVEKLKDEKYRTPGSSEPHYQYERDWGFIQRSQKKVWRSPAGNILEEIAVETGWFRVYHSKKEKLFWLMEIEGPDHGVHFYGPFPDHDLPEASGSK